MEKVHKTILSKLFQNTSCIHFSFDIWLYYLLLFWFWWLNMQVIFTSNMCNHYGLTAESWNETDSQVRQSLILFIVLEHLWFTSHSIIRGISIPNFWAKYRYMDKDSIMLHCAIHIRKGHILYENIWKVQLLGVNVNPGVYRSQVLPNFLLHVHYNICSLTINRHWRKS